jgi:hypothetical protein
MNKVILIRYVVYEPWGGKATIVPIGPKNNGEFETEEEAERALLDYLAKYRETEGHFIRKEYRATYV